MTGIFISYILSDTFVLIMLILSASVLAVISFVVGLLIKRKRRELFFAKEQS